MEGYNFRKDGQGSSGWEDDIQAKMGAEHSTEI